MPIAQFLGTYLEPTSHRTDVELMKTSLVSAFLVLVIGSGACLCSPESNLELLNRAAALNDQGQFRAAIELIEPLLVFESHKPDEAVAGVAWNIRALALQNLGNRDEARRSYETALRILRAVPDLSIQYATALDNLGSLEADSGQFAESKALRIRAKELYESVSDHAGAARISSNLALIALGQQNRKEARHYLTDAFYEESLVSTPDLRDLAWIDGVACLVFEGEGDFQAALDPIDRAIALWTRHYGSKYYLLALGYSLRGRVYDALRDYQRATTDLQHSLSLLSENNQSDTKVYFLTEIAYARVLRNSGMKSDASRVESQAQAALERLRHQQCGGCTISAATVR